MYSSDKFARTRPSHSLVTPWSCLLLSVTPHSPPLPAKPKEHTRIEDANLCILLAGPVGAHLTSSRAFASYRASQPPPTPLRALASEYAAYEQGAKPAICRADELHYAPVPDTEWRLALWRYRPLPEAPNRNHPVMLLSGVATNVMKSSS